ncbi:PfkB family carbohydrate kinase [Membranihabitans marinus]|uniref:PfkB family carbohydrate kinase n=1 Tax=Membranihabitans marinus TaxID=1227546 RepID=UPI001F3D28A4|nr:PfkB family carbohydrate kinase [Membranihabitans marinus]
MSLLIVGTVAFDTIETPHGKVEKVIGGAGTYAGWAASYLHSDIRLVSIIGGDWPKSELQRMNARGIDTEGIKIVEDKKSFYWSGRYLENLIERETLITDLNVLADFDPILPDSYRNSEFILLGNLTPAIQSSVIDQLESKPKLILLDTMNFWIDIAKDELIDVIRRVDLLSINDEEARMLSGEHNLVKAAEKIMKLGPRFLIIKKGEHGALLFGDDHMFFAPALPLNNIVDPTGAGDTFAGGLMGYLANQSEINYEHVKQGLVYGAAMGSFCVEDFSLEKIQNINSSEIDARIKAIQKLTTVDTAKL